MLLTFLVVLTSCGGDTGQGATTATTTSSTAATTTTNSATAAPTTTAANYGPLHKTVTFAITTKDGYKADIAVEWHQEMTISEGSLFQACRDLMLGTSEKADSGKIVMSAVVAEVTAQFPQVTGFSWPSDKTIALSYGDGKETQYWDRASTCFDSMDPNGSPAQLSGLAMSPARSSLKIMWVRTGEKTPKNPEGTPEGDPRTYHVAPSIDLDGSCVASDTKGDAKSYCRTAYGS
ncbi:hypothetical protein DL991_37710 [Amycolatopsis sp. WAC 01375]|uniref:hypothetical protein n=1 Tax=Amycolatopsis sp. WAC 01375 TaxID=2203194 RepID=UPI000F767A11|nr:hypothetical protein [Amycolatopsis sp. WAC 01375]RSM70398.1 hypothetical protein DL991_37710 [Amycolatopsis sp. WAC 01375]